MNKNTQKLRNRLQLLRQTQQDLLSTIQNDIERIIKEERIKTDYLANISHELRTPINAILGFSRILKKEISDPVIREDLDSIINNGNHLYSLVNNLLDLIRLEANQVQFQNEVVDVEKNLTQLITSNLYLEKPGVKIIRKINPYLPLTRGDNRRLGQVIFNILHNAYKFTDKGSITINTSADEKNIWIKIADTGIGISKGDIDKVFQKFRQVDSSTTRRHGAGIGMALSKEIIRQMDGQIWMESYLGKGTTVNLAIPIK